MRRDPFAWRRVATVAPEPDPLVVFLDAVVGMAVLHTVVRNADRFGALFEQAVAPLRWLVE